MMSSTTPMTPAYSNVQFKLVTHFLCVYGVSGISLLAIQDTIANYANALEKKRISEIPVKAAISRDCLLRKRTGL